MLLFVLLLQTEQSKNMNSSDINKEALKYLKNLSLKELRKRQDITERQIEAAYKRNLLDVIEILQLMQIQLDQAVNYVAFTKNKEGR